jgi:hypothetical protein
VTMMEWQFILSLKALIRNNVVIWNKVFWSLNNSKLNHNYVKYQSDNNTDWQIFCVYFIFYWSQSMWDYSIRQRHSLALTKLKHYIKQLDYLKKRNCI